MLRPVTPLDSEVLFYRFLSSDYPYNNMIIHNMIIHIHMDNGTLIIHPYNKFVFFDNIPK